MKIYDTPDQIVEAVEQHLLNLRQEGGKISLPINLTWQNDTLPHDPVRISNAGKCPKQMAYSLHYPDEREPLTARALSVFMHGDILHEMERYLISQVTHLNFIEQQVHFLIGNETYVPGHVDGVIALGDERVILDIKSINTRGFKEVINGVPRHDYIAQVNGYMHATGMNKAVLWFYNKDTSHRAAILVERDEEVVNEVRRRFLSVIASTPESLPERQYSWEWEISRGKRTGRQYLPWQCNYCPFVERCWEGTGFGLVFDKGKPRWMREAPEEENEP